MIKHIAFLTALSLSVAQASDLTKVGFQPIRGEKAPHLEGAFLLKGEIRGAMANDFARWIHTQSKRAIVIIDSPGGSLDAGMRMVRDMQGLSKTTGLETTCIIANVAASMAAIFSIFCHKTLIIPEGLLMFHRATYNVEGNPEEVQERVRFITNYLNLIDRQIAAQMGVSLAFYKAIAEHEAWMTGEEAQRLGYVDAIINDFVMPAPPPRNLLDEFLLRLFNLRIGGNDAPKAK